MEFEAENTEDATPEVDDQTSTETTCIVPVKNRDIASSEIDNAATSENIDATASENRDVAFSENMDTAPLENIDNPSSEKMDIASSENIDIASSENIDIASSETMDAASSENIDIAPSENIDTVSSENIDTASSKNIDIAFSENKNATSSENMDILSTENTNGISFEATNIISSEKIDVTPLENRDIASSTKVDATTSENGNIVPSEKNDIAPIKNSDTVAIKEAVTKRRPSIFDIFPPPPQEEISFPIVIPEQVTPAAIVPRKRGRPRKSTPFNRSPNGISSLQNSMNRGDGLNEVILGQATPQNSIPRKRGRPRKIKVPLNAEYALPGDIPPPEKVFRLGDVSSEVSFIQGTSEVKVPKKRGRKPKPKIPWSPDCSSDDIVPLDDVRIGDNDTGDESNEVEILEEINTIKRGYRRGPGIIYDVNDDPETIKEKRKKRAVELKLKNLKCSLNEGASSSALGKRNIKAPQRFELAPVNKRKSLMDDAQGHGELLANIPWIYQKLQTANLSSLRLLHRTIFRKQGMFSEKLIRKMAFKFSGFPFNESHPEIGKRRDVLDKSNGPALGSLCDILGQRRGSKQEMIDRVINFLLLPSQTKIEAYSEESMNEKSQRHMLKDACSSAMKTILNQDRLQVLLGQGSPTKNLKRSPNSTINVAEGLGIIDDLELSTTWEPPPYFNEGNGIKLKFIRALALNVKSASNGLIEFMHDLMFLKTDQHNLMKRNIFEFSGLKGDAKSNDYICRMQMLAAMPSQQLKLICQLLCLPTWHRSRQFLSDSIIDFLAAPRLSVMKKRVPPHFSDEISFSLDPAKVKMPEFRNHESEEIEIVPDIHIPDDCFPTIDCDSSGENEYLPIKLKSFPNIHSQVLVTSVASLNQLHYIMYLCQASQNSIRKLILDFAGFPFDEASDQYQLRRAFMEQLSMEDLHLVATVLCVTQYIVEESRDSFIDAILKFLMKPSALLSSSTIMPAPSQALSAHDSVVRKKATSTSRAQSDNLLPEILIAKVETVMDMPGNSISNAISSSDVSGLTRTINFASRSDLDKMKLSSEMQVVPLPETCIKKEILDPEDMPPQVRSPGSAPPPKRPSFDSDDDDDTPLAKMVGHPNDDQLRSLISKVMKESKLEDITMKMVVRKVFETYPNYDLGYRKEFIKSIVRQILSQMDDNRCSVTTTVINI